VEINILPVNRARAVSEADIFAAVCEPVGSSTSHNSIGLHGLLQEPLYFLYVDDIRFEVFTAVTMKDVVFCDVTRCGSCKDRRFRRT
jgi:hypothetical protein